MRRERKSEFLKLRVTKSLMRAIEKAAIEDRRDVSSFVRLALYEYLKPSTKDF